MTWVCPSCDRRYPDSGIGLPADETADQKTHCEVCDVPDKKTINLSAGDLEVLLDGEKLGPWLLELHGTDDLPVYIMVDEAESLEEVRAG